MQRLLDAAGGLTRLVTLSPERDADSNTYQTRKLDDGSSHRVLKNFPDEQQLRVMIEGFGVQPQYRQYEYFWTLQYQAAA